ncbi:MAG: hypothetical protein CFH30_01110 [Alphaproteobacteria bacterium MarineAlpha8_Bin1]|nr:MAG: hypothetical protein CFH30_01110 [Alphaproteobacteria bacterium MarineAlpha8_Bin1]|tara:strand:+ start:321 stop:824 length:504 start_codon:yes stop_codon:yes gene_type:complete
MTEQVVDIRDRIEKMRHQMSGDKVPESNNVKNKISTVQKLNVNKPAKDFSENQNSEKENFEKSSIKMNRGTSNFSDKDKKILDDKINENKDTIDSKNYEIPKKIYKNYQNQNTYDKDKKSVQFDQDQQSFPQFSLNVSNPISWKLMLLIMLMQLLTNIMLVVVLYLK